MVLLIACRRVLPVVAANLPVQQRKIFCINFEKQRSLKRTRPIAFQKAIEGLA
jgi:hypothetical protein